jgi:hypothetical protein
LAIRNLADLFNPKRVILAGSLSELLVLWKKMSDAVTRAALSNGREFGNRAFFLWEGLFRPRESGPGIRPDFSVPDSNFLKDFDLNGS